MGFSICLIYVICLLVITLWSLISRKLVVLQLVDVVVWMLSFILTTELFHGHMQMCLNILVYIS